MATFVTGSTGYLGSYLVAGILREHRDMLNLLVRAKSEQARVRKFLGDLTNQRFGLPDDSYHDLVDSTESIIHCAASLNRKSERQCLNVNLRGALEVIQLARRAQNRNGLRRYSQVSTVAVAGRRQDEIVTEDASIDFYSFLRSAYYQNRRAELREAIGLPPVVESPATSPSH